MLQNFDSKQQDILKQNIKTLSIIGETKKVVTTQYNNVLSKTFPNMDVDKTPVKEKERLYTAVVYYNPELKALTRKDLEQLKNNPPMQFTTQEHEQGLAYLTGSLNADGIKNNNLLRVLKNTGTQQLFIGEVGQDTNIPTKKLEQAKQAMQQNKQQQDNYRKEKMTGYRAVNYRETKPSDYLNKLLSDALMVLLYSHSQDQQQNEHDELEYELEKKKRQNRKKGRHSSTIRR